MVKVTFKVVLRDTLGFSMSFEEIIGGLLLSTDGFLGGIVGFDACYTPKTVVERASNAFVFRLLDVSSRAISCENC